MIQKYASFVEVTFLENVITVAWVTTQNV